MARGAGRAGGLCATLALLAALAAASDVEFRVPEVTVRHAAASKAVGTGRRNFTRSNRTKPDVDAGADAGTATGANAGASILPRYEEYFVEHEVSTKDARRAAKQLDLDSMEELPCGTCSAQELEYCESRALADHCCCERASFAEPLPWLPHTCYVGPRRCVPLAGNCAEYTMRRRCCCAKFLARRWKGILSSSSRLGLGGVSLLLLSMLLLVARL